MSQNVTINNVDYIGVPSIEIPKTGGGIAEFVDPSSVTATASDVLSTKVFIASDGEETEGTMTKRTSVYTVTSGEYGINSSSMFYMRYPANCYWVEKGSISGMTYVLADPTIFGTATASEVVSGATFTSASGVNLTGTAYNVLRGSKTSSTSTKTDAGSQTAYYISVTVSGTVYSISAKASNSYGYAGSSWDKSTGSSYYWACTQNASSGAKAIIGSSGNFNPNASTSSRTIYIPCLVKNITYYYSIVYK